MTKHIKQVAIKGNSFGNQYIREATNDLYSVWRVTYNKHNTGYIEILKYEAVKWNYEKSEVNPKFFENCREILNY